MRIRDFWSNYHLPAAMLLGLFISAAAVPGLAQSSAPSIVQPGAPGQPTKTLPANTRAAAPVVTDKDVEFMQGMIHHHAQAVEMVALMDGRTDNKQLRLLGAKISHSQADEMQFMRRWLSTRGKPTEMTMKMPAASGDKHGDHSAHGSHASHQMMMPGMLTAEQMEALAAAKGGEFDKLFLKGMIQHHEGALTMVRELFAEPGTGQDAELYNFAADVDTGQRAEIKIMGNLLSAMGVK